MLQFGSTEIRFHWTAFVMPLVFTRFEFRPSIWIACLALILVHELGHALACKSYRLRVYRLEVHGLGGSCVHERSPDPFEEVLIAWGGVLAQFFLICLATGLELASLVPADGPATEIFFVFTWYSAGMILLNLLPIGGLDGKTAWKIIPLSIAHFRRRSRVPTIAPMSSAAVDKEVNNFLDEIKRKARASKAPEK